MCSQIVSEHSPQSLQETKLLFRVQTSSSQFPIPGSFFSIHSTFQSPTLLTVFLPAFPGMVRPFNLMVNFDSSEALIQQGTTPSGNIYEPGIGFHLQYTLRSCASTGTAISRWDNRQYGLMTSYSQLWPQTMGTRVKKKKVQLVILRDLDVNEDHDSLVQKLAVFERNISEENGWSKRSLCRNSTNNRLLIQRSKTTEAYGIYLMYVTIALSISCFQLHPNVKCTAEEKNGFSKGKSPLFVSIIEG